MEGATVVMLGKVVENVFDDGKVETPAAGAAGAKGAPGAKGGAAPSGGAKPAAGAKAAAPAAKGGAKK